MRKLFVLRHAKSSWADPGQRDFDRPLNERGRAAANAVGRQLQKCGLEFDLVLASPARRVRQTIGGIEETFGGSLDPDFREAIYAASVETLLEVVQSASEDVENLLLVGHNPGLQELVLMLADAESGALRGEVGAKFPTAALATLEVRGGWDELGPGSCRLAGFVRPRDLAD